MPVFWRRFHKQPSPETEQLLSRMDRMERKWKRLEDLEATRTPKRLWLRTWWTLLGAWEVYKRWKG